MAYKNKCRVCLADGAKHPIFDGVEAENSTYSKLFQCFKEKIENNEGYPQNICQLCMDILDTVHNFITKYNMSKKLLESGLVVVKNEVFSDIEVELELQENNSIHFEENINICKNEPITDSDGLEPLEFSDTEPIVKKTEKEINLTEIKAKLKNLKEINFKKKRVRKSRSKASLQASNVSSSILEADFDWNGESLKSQKLKKNPQEIKLEQDNKLVLPKTPKKPSTHQSRLCDYCGETFDNRDKLNQHKQRKHLSESVKCPKCPRVLVSEYYLRRHLKKIHDKIKEFTCDTCGNAFTFKGDLTTHYNAVHLKLRKKKRYECLKCSKDFVTAKSLLIHDRSAHTGIRPAECEVCGSCFFHEDYLKEHMRLHTGETPFKCPICDRGYAQRGNLRSHITHNHRLEDLTPEQKSKLKPQWFKYLKKP